MSLRTIVDTQRRLVTNPAWGTVSDEDFLRARRDLIANPLFEPTFDRLWDFSGVTEETLSDGTVAQMVATSPSDERVCRAVVCTTPTIVSRVMEFVAKSRQLNRKIAVFPTRERAEAWIESQRQGRPDQPS